MCTIYRVVVYISGSVALPQWQQTILLCMAHVTILGVPGWVSAETTRVARFVDGVPPQL